MRDQARGLMVLTVAVFLGAVPAQADGPLSRVHVDASAGPLRIQESESHTTTKTVINGPKGTRTIAGTDNASERELLNSRTVDTDSDVAVSGVRDTGLVVGQKVFMQGQRQPINLPAGSRISNRNGITTVTTVDGGPGSVHTETHSQTTVTPPVRIIVK